MSGEPFAELRRQRLRVRGRVQGVGFRWFVQARARALGVTGWVQNLADGDVLCEAQAPAAALGAFAAELQKGPRHARVDAVDVEEMPRRDGENAFEITG